MVISRMEDNTYNAILTIPFPSKRIAEIAYDVLRVDQEPKRSGVTKTLTVENTYLKIELSAKLARQLRVSITSLCEKIDLITSTIDIFGPPVSEKYDFY